MYTHTFLGHKYYKIGDIYMIRKMLLFSLLWPRPHVAGIFFRSEFRNFPVHKHCRQTRPTRSTAILFYCSVRDWAQLCYVILKNPNSPSTRYRVSLRIVFSTLEDGIKKYPDSLPNSQDACGSKPYSERKMCGFKNTRGRALINRELTPRTPSSIDN